MQLQCPNCTGYKNVNKEEKILVDPQTGALQKVLTGKLWKDTSSVTTRLLIICGILTIPCGIVLASRLHTESIFIAMAVLGAIIVMIARLTERYEQRRRYRMVKRYSCYCSICGYQWHWREDQPYPAISKGPEASRLLSQGIQRLEEERLRAAGIYWYQQQQRQGKN